MPEDLIQEWRANVIEALKEIREDQKELRKDVNSQAIIAITKEDLKSFISQIEKIDTRLTKIESLSSKFIGAAIILNFIFVGIIQYLVNIFKTK